MKPPCASWWVRVVGVASTFGLVACSSGADVRIDGDVGGRPLRATGTVAAWVDRTAYAFDDVGGVTLQDRAVGETRLHLRFFEAVFDAAISFDRLPTAERDALDDELTRGDSIAIDVERGAALRDGDRIERPGIDGLPEVLPYIAAIEVALRDAGRGTETYPDSLPAAVVVDDSVSFAVASVEPRIAGEITFRVAAVDDAADDDDIVVAFSAALLPERVAECNFDRAGAGVVDACSLAPTAP
jgi:hypothetical protein